MVAALLELPRPIKINKFVSPAKLVAASDVLHGDDQKIIVIGMGIYENGSNAISGVLRQAELVTIDSQTCSDKMKFKRDPDTIVCASTNFDNYQTTNVGDSGKYAVGMTFYSPYIEIDRDWRNSLKIVSFA